MSLRNAILAIVIAMMGGVFMLDAATGRDIDLWVLYLLPIGLVSLVLGARYGYALTLVAAILLLATTGLYQRALPTALAFASERGIETLALVVCAYLVGWLRLALADAGADDIRPMDTPSRMN